MSPTQPAYFTRRILLAASVAVAGAGFLWPVPLMAQIADTRWIVEAGEARTMLAEGALLLDTRSEALRAQTPIEGALPVVWQAFTFSDLPNRGQLLDDDAALTGILRDLGVSADRAVIVLADNTQGWGEDGRIVWTLRTLGHERSFMVNGGVMALVADGPVTLADGTVPGDFTVNRTDRYDMTKEEISERLGSTDLVILDTREAREFDGATPFGEMRGGHLPGAQHIYFRDLVDTDGRVLEGEELREKLTALGVNDTSQIVSYCTGGIRSGFVTAVLQNAGIDARNYAGSIWEWSASAEEDYPLIIQ